MSILSTLCSQNESHGIAELGGMGFHGTKSHRKTRLGACERLRFPFPHKPIPHLSFEAVQT
jgi:hypothetical protein